MSGLSNTRNTKNILKYKLTLICKVDMIRKKKEMELEA